MPHRQGREQLGMLRMWQTLVDKMLPASVSWAALLAADGDHGECCLAGPVHGSREGNPSLPMTVRASAVSPQSCGGRGGRAMLDFVVDSVRAAVFVAAQLFGGSIGAGIVAVSLAIRLGLLPLTLRLARRAAVQQALLARLRPELSRLRDRYRERPDELWRRTQALYRQSGYRPFDPQALLGGLLQAPVLAAVYGAVRRGLGVGASFLWVADLARPDAVLALAVATLTALATFLGVKAGPQPQQAATQATISGLVMLLFFGRASSALLLSWTGSALGGVVQAVVLWRGRGRSGGR